MRELRVKLYLEQNEDCGLGDSTSDCSERPLQRGGGKARTPVVLVNKYTHNHVLIFLETTTSLVKPSLVMRSSHHYKGVSCFSSYVEL